MIVARPELWMALALALAGCAGARTEQAAEPVPTGGQRITIVMSGFSFRPDVVTLRASVPTIVSAVSDSRIPHNITILSLDGQTLKSVDVPARQITAFEIALPGPGRYVFYCDKFLHRALGMEGTFVARGGHEQASPRGRDGGGAIALRPRRLRGLRPLV